MLLRRITEHVKAQNWTAVALDFVIVVTGVFIGIQVSNGNDARKDRALERQYLERLFDDANGTIEDFNRTSSWEEERLMQQYEALTALRRGSFDPAKRETVAKGLAFAGLLNPLTVRWGTAKELQTTGNISMIRDIELRTMLAATESYYERSNAIVNMRLEQTTDLRSVIARKYDLRRYAYFGGIETRVEIDFDFEGLANDKEFIAVFAENLLAEDIVYTFSVANTMRMEALRDYLADKLGKDAAELPTTRDLTNTWPWRITQDNAQP